MDSEAQWGYLRQTPDGEILLIPEDEIDEHDELEGELLQARLFSNEWYALSDKYNGLYMGYQVVMAEIFEMQILLE